MSIRKTMVTMAIMATVLVIMAGLLHATPPRSSRLFDWKLEPLEPPKGPGVIDMLFEFTPTKICSMMACTEAEILVITKGGLEFLGPHSWKQPVKYGETYSQVIQVNVPPNDTCGVWIEMHSPVYSRTRAVAYFVSSTDSVEFWKGYPRRSLGGPGIWEQIQANTPVEKLQEIVEVRIDMRSVFPGALKRVLDLVGEMKPTDKDSVCTARISRDDAYQLGRWGVVCDIIRQPAPLQPDSNRIPRNRIDSLEQQGVLDSLRNLRGDGAFWLDGAYPLTSEGKLPLGEDVTLYLHILNNTNTIMKGVTNGFRVYSPDGATWSSAVGDARSA